MSLNATDRDRMSRPRYLGLPTFMRAPYCEDPSGLDIAMIGVPYDGGVDEPPGGPAWAARGSKPVVDDPSRQPGDEGQPARAVPGRRHR